MPSRSLIALALSLAPAAHALPLPPGLDLPGDHARHQEAFGALPPRARALPRGPLPPPTPGPDVIVYGYQAYWDNDLYAVPWDDLSHLAIFAAEASSTGTLTQTARWSETGTALALAQPYGVRVHLCVINFNTSSLETLLGSATYRNALIADLQGWVDSTGAHGINVDFEGMPANRRQQMVDFVIALEAAVGEVVLATPAVDWSGAWDYATLSQHADLFIMGYGYHWSGSGNAGPTDPLISGAGTVWPAQHSLTWTTNDYLTKGADPARVILGLPLYGLRFPVANNNVPTANTGTGTSVFMRDGVAEAPTWGGSNFEDGSRSRWYHTGTHQVWYPETDTVRERVQYAVDAGIGGVGFWALHYDDDDPAFWDMIRQETTWAVTEPGDDDDDATPEVPDAGGYVADAGRPFLAYVGDTVFLSGAGSRGPEGAALEYRWEQVSGPPVSLSDGAGVSPSFEVQAPGTHVFELTVGTGEAWSAPAHSHVVVVDPGAGRRHFEGGCGCDAGRGATLAVWLAIPLVLLRRRRR